MDRLIDSPMKAKKTIKKTTKRKYVPKKQYQPTTIAERKIVDFFRLCVILLLGIIIYSNSIDCSFQLDDIPNIVENPKIHNLSDLNTLWNISHTRFIPNYTLAVNYHFGELNVEGYHRFNLIIHLINACLVYWLSLLIFSSPALKRTAITNNKTIIAFITALLFVSHPLATNVVTYIVQRLASLAAMFYFLSLIFYMKGRLVEKKNQTKFIFFTGSIVAAVLAMLSKENAFTLPFAILLFEIVFFQSKKLSINIKDYRIIILAVGLLGFIFIVTSNFSLNIFNTLPPDEHNNFTEITSINYLLTQFSAIVKYIQLLILPINQNLDYDFRISNSFFEIRTILSFLFLLSLVILAIFQYKKNRIISFGIFWFLLTLSIESSFIPISDVIFEHRTYLPSFGFFIIVSSVIFALLWKKHKKIALAVLTIIIVSNSFLTYERNKVWKDQLTLYSDIILKSPYKPRAYINRGIEYMATQKYNMAIDDLNKAIELNPQYANAYYNLGIISRNEGKFDRALEDYSKAIVLKPDYYNAYTNRGEVYILKGEYSDGIQDLNKAIELDPNLPYAYVNRGIAESNLGNKEKSCRDFKRAIALGFTQVEERYKQNCQ
jgi:tetratricopeptide (TPR) repeat protein